MPWLDHGGTSCAVCGSEMRAYVPDEGWGIRYWHCAKCEAPAKPPSCPKCGDQARRTQKKTTEPLFVGHAFYWCPCWQSGSEPTEVTWGPATPGSLHDYGIRPFVTRRQTGTRPPRGNEQRPPDAGADT